MRGVGRQDLGPLFAAVGVEGAGQQQAGELAVGAGRGLEADVGQAADLAQRLLQQPHQLERALGALRVLGRVQPGVPGKGGDPLVEARVVLHRAGAERVEAGVEVEVPAREAVVVADDLGLGDLGQARRLLAQQLRRDQVLERGLRDFGVGQDRGPPPRLRALVDRQDRFLLLIHINASRFARCTKSQRWTFARSALVDSLPRPLQSGNLSAHRLGSNRAPSASASSSIWARVRRSVIATSSPSGCSG